MEKIYIYRSVAYACSHVLISVKKGFEAEYFPSPEKTSKETNSCVGQYKSILTSKSTEDTLVYIYLFEDP